MKQYRIVILLTALALLFGAVNATAQTYTPLYTYPNTDNNTSGITYPSILSQGEDGDLYSTIETNGAYTYGSVYRMTTAGAYSLIYSFCAEAGPCGSTGGNPEGGVTLGLDGNFWGTTLNGGKDSAGTVFKITPAGTLTLVYSFTNGNDDSAPVYTVLQGQDGNMYGVSEAQYEFQYGSFFKLTTKGKITPHPLVYATDGAAPNLPALGTDGNFYGTAQTGGDATCKCGLIYKVTAGGKFTVLHKFTGINGTPADGSLPYGILVEGTDGNFYGTTYEGGANTTNGGTVFKITPSGTYTLLHSFDHTVSNDAQLPTAGLTLGSNGNFYGVTERGGTQNGGAIFEITPSGTETVLYNFCVISCYDGFVPTTPMVQHTNGTFYGNTSGNSNGGSVFYSLNVGLPAFVKLITWSGKVGTKALILGQGFTSGSEVSFDGVAATAVTATGTSLTATVPAGAETGHITVTTTGGTLTSDRVFYVKPQVKSFTPASGVVGTKVTITGVSLKQTTHVTIGGKSAAFTVVSDTEVTATVPVGAKTGTAISFTTAGGTAGSPTKFVVVPEITSFSPADGPVGTSVTITGNSFTGATQVTFGGVAATTYKVVNDTEVTAVVPTGAVTGAIAVTTLGGVGTSSAHFTVN